MSSNPTMPEIRAAIDKARALAGLEDTEDFALQTPALLQQLVAILDLYVGHEPTLTEEAGARATQPPLKGLVRQIRATANEELLLPTTYGKRAVQEFARDLERWIPEGFEPDAAPGGGQLDKGEWVFCSHRNCPNGERANKATERGWMADGQNDTWLCDQHATDLHTSTRGEPGEAA